jgi:hypothetical protein
MPKICRWNEGMENALLDFLIQEIKEGKWADNSFKAKTWEDAVPIVNAHQAVGLSESISIYIVRILSQILICISKNRKESSMSQKKKYQ